MTIRNGPPPPDQAARDRIRRDLGTTFLVEAGAGSGKTTSLVDRMVALLADGRASIDTLTAVTFTRKAAAELRGRFQVALERERLEAGDAAARARLDAPSWPCCRRSRTTRRSWLKATTRSILRHSPTTGRTRQLLRPEAVPGSSPNIN